MGYRVKALEAGSPCVGLGRLGGPSKPPALILPLGEQVLPQPLDQPVLPSSPDDLPSSLLQRGKQFQNLEKLILEKAGKQNGPQKEAAIS